MENIYKQYFESMPCFVTVQDRDFRIINANKRFTEVFGAYDGRQCFQVYKQRPEKCDSCPVEKTFREGSPHQSEELFRTPAGKEIWVIVNTTPILNGKGEITAVMEMSADITDIKLHQEKLKESQERYQLIFEEVPCYISIQDRELRIVKANRFHREAFGTSYGSKCYEVYKHRTKECLPCIVRQTFKDGKVHTHEEVVTSRDNERLNVLVTTAPIINAGGEIERVIEMSADITKIRQLQDKLTSIGLLIGSISHTIKGLLNGLDAGIYLVNTGLVKNDRDRIDQGWGIATRNIDRVRTLVLNILNYAKERELTWEPIAADAFTRDVCKIMEEKAGNLNIKFSCDIASDAGTFEADSPSIRSVLVNILENSLDACRMDTKKSEHRIAMKVTGTPDSVMFEVEDNGLGMDRETREKAFSLFFSSKGAGGTGLGLFVSDKIVKSHGGSIAIDAEQGKGSRLTITLPRKRPAPAEQAEEPAS